MKVFAHRGASGYAPENTLEAFQLAIDHNADGVELDIHLTRDKQLIVTHDERIERVSDGNGLVAMMSLKDLKKHLFNKTHPEYREARAPTLEEALEFIENDELLEIVPDDIRLRKKYLKELERRRKGNVAKNR